MKAYVADRYKGPLTLADLPEPTVGEHDVLVDIHAAGVNGLDAKLRSGEFKLVLPYKTPFALGHDLAGVVAQTGAKVTRFAVGDEVFGRARDGRIGTFAQRLPSMRTTWHASPEACRCPKRHTCRWSH